jgi:hypothetical protein
MVWDCLIVGLLLGLFDCWVILVHSNGLGLIVGLFWLHHMQSFLWLLQFHNCIVPTSFLHGKWTEG